MRYLPIAIIGAVLFVLGGCAPIVWDKPSGTQAEFNVDNARCRMVARGLNPGGFVAAGSTEFVAGAALGNAIGTAANQRATYRDCMEMQGYAEHGGAAAAEASYQSEVLASDCGGRPGGLSGGPGEPPKIRCRD
jgi:hypothetical protein